MALHTVASSRAATALCWEWEGEEEREEGEKDQGEGGGGGRSENIIIGGRIDEENEEDK